MRKEHDGYIDDIFREAGWFERFFFGNTVAERGYFIGTLAETAREKINDFDRQLKIEHFNLDLGKPRIAETDKEDASLVKAKGNISPEDKKIQPEDFQKVAEDSLQERIEIASDLIVAQEGENNKETHSQKGE